MKIGLIYKHFKHPISRDGIKIVPSVQKFTILRDRDIIKHPHIPKNSQVGAWLTEPPCTIGVTWEHVLNNQRSYTCVLSHHRNWTEKHFPYNGIYVPYGGMWVKPDMYKKTKNISMIASNKTQTEGHKIRHQIIDMFKKQIDVYGTGYRYVKTKEIALADYRYTIVIESKRICGYFSEKLNDAIGCGCIPIYWGDPTINDYYDINGMICFENTLQLNEIMKLIAIGSSKVQVSESAMRKNLETAQKYSDIYRNLIRALLKRPRL